MSTTGIEYRIIRRRDVEAAGEDASSDRAETPAGSIPRSGELPGDAARNPIPCYQDVDLDDVCGIVAYEGSRTVARIALVYTQLLVDGRLKKCVVGSSFFVDEDYRSRAVGLSILLKVLALGLPYIEASVSGQMQEILERFPKFKQVDKSPIFQVPVDQAGIMQMARWDLYGQESPVSGYFADKILKARILVSLWQQRRRIMRCDNTVVQVTGPDKALEYCLGHFQLPQFRVQLPWTVAGLHRALSGSNPNRAAWLLKVGNDGPWLISMYRRERVLGYDDAGQPRTLLEAHLNEIYPPPDSVASILQLLSFAMERAREMSAHVMHIYAITPRITEACEHSGLRSRTRKSIFIAPVGVEEAERTVLSNAGNWLCRAVSEDEFEESFSADASTAKAFCVPTAG